MSTIEWFAVIFSLAYVILAAKENIWCWLFGLISVVLYFFFFKSLRLYSDTSLQVFYMIMSVYGFFNWRRNAKNEMEPIPIVSWPLQNHLLAVAIGVVLVLFLGWFWKQFDASLPYIDAFTSAFAIIATCMVVWKVLENWLYWIVIDIVCVGVYMYKEAWLTAGLFAVYCVIAVVGWREWKRKWAPQATA